MRRSPVIRRLLFASVLVLLACGPDLPGVEQPGPDALTPDAPASGDPVAALPSPRFDGEPLPVSPERPGTWLTAGLGPDLGVVVWSGVNPQDDRPTAPPDDVRDQ